MWCSRLVLQQCRVGQKVRTQQSQSQRRKASAQPCCQERVDKSCKALYRVSATCLPGMPCEMSAAALPSVKLCRRSLALSDDVTPRLRTFLCDMWHTMGLVFAYRARRRDCGQLWTSFWLWRQVVCLATLPAQAKCWLVSLRLTPLGFRSSPKQVITSEARLV